MPAELLNNVPNKSSKEKKVESWLRNRSDNKSFVEIELSDLDEINDGFTRMFDRVAVDYRMNMIRSVGFRSNLPQINFSIFKRRRKNFSIRIWVFLCSNLITFL